MCNVPDAARQRLLAKDRACDCVIVVDPVASDRACVISSTLGHFSQSAKNLLVFYKLALIYFTCFLNTFFLNHHCFLPFFLPLCSPLPRALYCNKIVRLLSSFLFFAFILGIGSTSRPTFLPSVQSFGFLAANAVFHVSRIVMSKRCW